MNPSDSPCVDCKMRKDCTQICGKLEKLLPPVVRTREFNTPDGYDSEEREYAQYGSGGYDELAEIYDTDPELMESNS